MKLSNITKRYAGTEVLRAVSFVVNPGERAGLVGPNGSGKTTLLRIAAGEERPDTGAVDLPHDARIGYVRQGYAHLTTAAVSQIFPSLFPDAASSRLEALAQQLATTPTDDLERAYNAALDVISQIDPAAAEAAMRDLNLRHITHDEPITNLSGGEQTKLALAHLAATRPTLLLLDEPTNNLDLDALAWLDQYLDNFPGPILIVSHDRALLDDHAAVILELDPNTHAIEEFAGDYTAYANEKARRHEEQLAAYRRQLEQERKMKREIAAIRDTASRREHISQNDYYRRRNKKFARRSVVLARRLERDLAATDRVDKPRTRPYNLKTDLTPTTRSGASMLATHHLTVTTPNNSSDVCPLISDLSLTIAYRDRIAIIGPNGSGKTTLLRTLAGQLPPASGHITRSPSLHIGYLPQSDTDLLTPTNDPQPPTSNLQPTPTPRHPIPVATPTDLIRQIAPLDETEARRFLHRFLFTGDDALKPIIALSYGERRRLALAKLVLSGANLLLLDEPTNHLDIPSREAFEAALENYDGAILAVTHDRYFIDRLTPTTLHLQNQSLTPA